VSRQRRSHRLPAADAAHRRRLRRGRASGDLVFSGAGFQLLELQFQLIEQLAAALGRLPKPLALHLGDRQLQIGDHRFGTGRPSFRLLARRALGSQCRLHSGDIVGRCHKPDYRIGSRPDRISTIG